MLTIAVQKGNLPMATLLLDNDADVNAGSCTPLIQATRGWHVEMVCLLLERGASFDDVTEDGKTALTIAIEKGNLQMTTLLLDNRTGINAGMDGSCTSLIQAALHKNQEIARLFTIMAHIPHFPCPGTVAASSEGLSLNNFHISRSAARFP